MPEDAQADTGDISDLPCVSGTYSFLSVRTLAVRICLKKYHPLDDLDKVGWKLKGIHTKYYEPRLHAGVFALPAYEEELLEDVER